MNRQTELHKLVMKLQLDQMKELKEWITKAEERLSQLQTPVNPDSLTASLETTEQLLNDLESQQSVVASISNFIMVDTGEVKDIGSLEEELSALGDRWVSLCNMTEQRYDYLQIINSLCSQFKEESQLLESWIVKVESRMKHLEMETENIDKELLEQQGIEVMEAEVALEDYEKKLLLVGDVGQELQDRLNPSEEEFVRFITSKLEDIEDR